MYDSIAIASTETSRHLRVDGNTNGPVSIAVSLTGPTGTVDVEATISRAGAANDLTNAVWIPISAAVAADEIISGGPFTAVRLNGTSLSAGTALIQVLQAGRV